MKRPSPRRFLAVASVFALLSTAPARAEEPGLVTRPSTHALRPTIDAFEAAVRDAGWVVFTEIDHAAAAKAAGMTLRPRTVVIFGNPETGTPAMQSHPTLAIDLPMRVLVWEDDQGRVQVTRSTGADIATRIFARHGIDIPPAGATAMDDTIGGFVRRATD